MSRAARNSKVLRSGAIGFVAGLATLGVVAHGSPAHGLVSSALGTGGDAASLALGTSHHEKHRSTQPSQPQTQQSLDAWLQQQLSQSQQAQPQQAQPQYQQPQQQYVQPAPSQQPQSQAS